MGMSNSSLKKATETFCRPSADWAEEASLTNFGLVVSDCKFGLASRESLETTLSKSKLVSTPRPLESLAGEGSGTLSTVDTPRRF